MFIINFNDLKKGQTIRGGLTPVKILLTLAYLKFKGYKPFRFLGYNTKIKVK